MQMSESDSREIRVIFDHNGTGRLVYLALENLVLWARILYFIFRFPESQHLTSTRNYLFIN